MRSSGASAPSLVRQDRSLPREPIVRPCGFPLRSRLRAVAYRTFSALWGSPHPLFESVYRLAASQCLASGYARRFSLLVLVALRRPHHPRRPFSSGYQRTGVSRGGSASEGMGAPAVGTRSARRTRAQRMRLQAIAEAWYKDAEEIGCRQHEARASPKRALSWSGNDLCAEDPALCERVT